MLKALCRYFSRSFAWGGILLSVALSGCLRTAYVNDSVPPYGNTPPSATLSKKSLEPAQPRASRSVEEVTAQAAAELDTGGERAQSATTPPESVVVLSTTPSSLNRTDLLGGWTISSGGDSCRLFMTLTSWSGGYRATTKACSSSLLSSISAWDLIQNKFVLKDGQGQTLAWLSQDGTALRYIGQTSYGQTISVSR